MYLLTYVFVFLFIYGFLYTFLFRWICRDYIGVYLGMYWDYIGCRGEVSFRTWSGVGSKRDLRGRFARGYALGFRPFRLEGLECLGCRVWGS